MDRMKTRNWIFSGVIITAVFAIAFLPAFASARFTPAMAYDWRTDEDPQDAFIVNIMNPQDLEKLENAGYSFGEVIGGNQQLKTTAELYAKNPFYKQFADQVSVPLQHDPKTDQMPLVLPPGSGDIPEMIRLIRNFEDKGSRSDKDTKGGYFIRHLSNNSQYPYRVESDGDEPRHFDGRWLNSMLASMQLIGVVNRMDKIDFDPNSCGEVRLIYRLVYQGLKSSSSLPFFANVVLRYPKKADCQPFRKAWTINQRQVLAQRKAEAKGAALFADWLSAGPLKESLFKQLELNFESLRFTSGYMHDFGGQAMYIQRIFRMNKGSLVTAKLENTPNVLLLEKDPQLLKRLTDLVLRPENLQKLDAGILVLPEEFLTDFSVSWSTLGRVRSANKPFQRLLAKSAALDKVDFKQLSFIKTPQALLERLDNLTCMGCHQSGGTAGFHFLGEATEKYSHGFNRQELGLSPHAFAEIYRRESYGKALLNGQAPNRFRPLSTFPEADWSQPEPKYATLKRGALCVLKGRAEFATAPSCEAGTVCEATVTRSDGPQIHGECVLAPTGDARENLAGAVCWKGRIEENTTLPSDRGTIPSFNFFAFQDKWKLLGSVRTAKAQALGSYKCVLPQSGAPLGRMSRPCTVAEENFADFGKLTAQTAALEVCANQGGNGFDLCAATGDSGACLESRVVRSMLDTCMPGRFCREDYVCQKFPDYHKISRADYTKKKNGKPVNLSTPDQIRGDLIQKVRDEQIGFCVPTYFLFNMRVDGHPSPVTGVPPGEPVVDRRQPVRGYR
jgi:hypothetical protein